MLSRENPFFYAGSIVHGIGSPHTPADYVWPLGLLAQAFSSVDDAERRVVLAELIASDPGDHKLHESFDPSDVKRLTRKDFGWPNALFAEYLLTRVAGRAPLPLGSAADLHAPPR